MVAQTGQKSDTGSSTTIVGIFDTIGKGYKNPTDIVAYKGGKAAMSTTSGHLVLLDINIPQFAARDGRIQAHARRTTTTTTARGASLLLQNTHTLPSPLVGEGGG